VNDQHAVRVIALLTAAWPETELPDATLALWIDAMKDLDPAVGMEAAATLTRTKTWFPRLAEFLEAVSAIRRRVALNAGLVRALPPIPPAGRLLAKARLIAIREVMGQVGSDGTLEQTHTSKVAGCPGCAALAVRVDEIRAELEAGAA